MQRAKLFQCYKKLLHRQPYIVQTSQTVALLTVGDVISQTCIEKKNFNEINYYRVIKFGSIGFILGPALITWYRYLEKIKFNSANFATLKRIVMDQLIFAPSALAGITTLVSLSDGKTLDEIKRKFQADYFHMLSANYKLWPFVQYVNFSFIPLDYRVLVTQVVAIAWNTYLSWKLNSDET